MSLRAKILLAVVTVNLGVTVLLTLFLDADRNARDEERRVQEQRSVDLARDSLRRSFGGFLTGKELEIEGPGRERLQSDPTRAQPYIMREILQHPVRRIISDGVIISEPSWARGTIRPRLLATGQSGDEWDVDPSAVYINLLGAKDRAEEFDPVFARQKILEAVENESMREGELEGALWVAAPIRLRPATNITPGEGWLWGGGFFLLSVPQAEVPVESFGRRTMLVSMLIGTLVLVLVTYLVLDRWMLRPLGRLAQGAERVGSRHFEEPVPGGVGSDEISRLITSFNAMMAEVGDSQRSLTERVEEATRRDVESRRGLVIAQRLAATGTLASGIAHEINNPLGGMLNAALRVRDELKGRQGTERQVRYLELLVGGLQRIQDIVKRVLTFSPRQVEPRETPVREILNSAVALAEHRARQAQVKIGVQGDNPVILAEAGEVQQVFLNLLINACDAMQEGGGEVRIQVRDAGEWVDIDVEDDGPGMTEEQRERAFDLFFSTKEVGQGTGLGLSVASHIVTQHGGSLTVTSAPGGGCRFRVRLPASPASDSRAETDAGRWTS